MWVIDMADFWKWLKDHKVRVLAIAGAVFALAAGLGSTILSEEQRQAIMVFLGVLLG